MGGGRVLREQIQRREIHQDEVPASIGVEGVECRKHAVRVVDQRSAGNLGIGQESAVAKVVCADPDRVDGILSTTSEKFGPVCGRVLGVGEEGGQFVFLK